MGRIDREKNTVQKMIRLNCAKKHEAYDGICENCESLSSYSIQRLETCQFGAKKPACSKCPVHCYSKSRREEIKEVMRYAGPRMIYKNPYLAIMHLVDKKTLNNQHSIINYKVQNRIQK